MNIRDAIETDVPGILDIWNGVIRDTMITFTSNEKTPEGILRMIPPVAIQDVFLMAEDAHNKVLGFCLTGPFRNGPGYAGTREITIHLAAAARGTGLGRALVEQVITRLRAREVHTLIGGVSADNTAGIAFHKALGFGEVGRLPGVGKKSGQSLDLVFMHKTL